MHSLLKVMERGIFRAPARRKRKVEVKPSDIPTLKDYTARPVDKKWPPERKEATCVNQHVVNAPTAANGSSIPPGKAVCF